MPRHEHLRLRRAAAGALTALALALPAVPVVGLGAGVAVAAAPSDVKFEFGVDGNYSASKVTAGSTVQLRLTAQFGGVWTVQGYAWKVDGVVVDGETAREFTTSPAHTGKKLEVDVTIQRDTFKPVTFTEVITPSVAPSKPVVSVSGRAVAGQTLTMTHDQVAAGETQWTWAIDELRRNGDGSTYYSEVTVGYTRTLFVKREWVGKEIVAKASLDVPGHSFVLGTAAVKIDASVPADYVEPKPVTPPSTKPTPTKPTPPQATQPTTFAKMGVKAPAKVKSGKRIVLRLTRVSGKVTVKASHQKKAVAAKVAKGSAKVVVKAPKLKKRQTSRVVRMKVVMKGAQGNNQTRTIKVRVVR